MSLNVTSISSADRLAFRSAFDQLRAETRGERYYTDPGAWVRDVLGAHPWSRQVEIMQAVADNRLVTVQSAHGVGKSQLAAWLALWFVSTRPGGLKTKVVTSAPTAFQVKSVLWGYIREGHEHAEMPGYITHSDTPEWKINGHQVAYGRKPSDHQQSSFQGAHADHLLVILDEAGGIPKWLWDASDSLMTGENDQHLLAIGNPDDNSSHFYSVCTTEPLWERFKISAFDAPAFTDEDVPDHVRSSVVNHSYVDEKIERWGEQSPLYRVKVLGEFVDAEDSLIPLSWVQAANRRWVEWNDNYDGIHEPRGRKVFGVDVAWEGDDKTAIATRQGDVVLSVETFSKLDTTQTSGLVEARLRGTVQGLAVVDVVGVGAGVVDQLRRASLSVRAFNGGNKAPSRDSTGSWEFPNKRCWSWWNLRELLDPAMGASLCLPPDDDLTNDLIAPGYEPRTGGKLWVEDKASVKKRLKRSPDRGDALAMACSVEKFPRADDADRPPLRPVAYTNKGGSWA